MNNESGHPAFSTYQVIEMQSGPARLYHTGNPGLTKREYAAIHILAGLLANKSTIDLTIEQAIMMADKLFNQLHKIY